MNPKPKPKSVNWIWPKIDNVAIAQTVLARGAGSALFQTVAHALLITSVVFHVWKPPGWDVDAYAYVDPILLGTLTYFIRYKQSRVAILLMLAYVVTDVYLDIAATAPADTSYGWNHAEAMFVMLYVNALRAAFFLHSARKQRPVDTKAEDAKWTMR